MEPYRVGIIACGRPRSEPGATGFGQGHLHAQGFAASPDCTLAAAADLDVRNLQSFREQWQIPSGYADYR